jgi:hypothetical protein
VTDPTDRNVWPIARLRQIGSAGWIGAAALAVVGSFLPLYEQNFGIRNAFAVTVWGFESDAIGEPGDELGFPAIGAPLVIAVALLVAAGLFGLASTRLHPASGPVLAARLLGTGGAGLLAGTVSIILLFTDALGGLPDGASATAATRATGFGTWLLMAAVLLAAAAIVLLLVPRLGRRGEEPETPPMGIPIVRVLEPEYEETDPKG